MKNFTKVLLLMVLSVAFVLVGCSSGLEMPGEKAEVFGNGGAVVQKGEYLYFTNAYTSYSSLEEEVSNGKKNKEYGIYRVKLTSINNKGIAFDEDSFAKNVQMITPTLSGFESSGLYIVGDYLFFSSPNMHKTRNNENRFDYVTFFSVKLDGRGLRELYTTTSSQNADWKIYEIEGENYLVTVEGDKIIRHTINKNRLKNKVVLAENVQNALLPQTIESDFDKTIYFTANFSEKEIDDLHYTGNTLNKVNIESRATTQISRVSGETFTLLSHSASRLFYEFKSNHTGEDSLYVLGQGKDKMRLSFTTGKSDLFFMGEGKPLIYKANSKIMMQMLTMPNTDSPNLDSEVLIDGDAKVLFVSGDYVYYSQNNSLNRISFKQKEAQKIIEGATENANIDFDGRYIYLYKTLEGIEGQVKYLHRVDTFTVETAREAKFEIVGFVLEEDVSSKKEADKAKQESADA